MRGNLGCRRVLLASRGPIPACAGQPCSNRLPPIFWGAYPRVCGATMQSLAVCTAHVGLSPRVRGNRVCKHLAYWRSGPIPACAGQPQFGQGRENPRGAYPRVCGATGQNVLPDYEEQGLSPRVRGNLHRVCRVGASLGPIPACAGQPTRNIMDVAVFRAYPRVCGATAVRPGPRESQGGLSPRVRGNRPKRIARLRRAGPIPACAGQPAPRLPRWRVARAYPRVCGATYTQHHGRSSFSGLSPRVRGNRPWLVFLL